MLKILINHIYTWICTVNHFYRASQIWHSFIAYSGSNLDGLSLVLSCNLMITKWVGQKWRFCLQAFHQIHPDLVLSNMEEITPVLSPFISGLVKKMHLVLCAHAAWCTNSKGDIDLVINSDAIMVKNTIKMLMNPDYSSISDSSPELNGHTYYFYLNV